MMSVSLSGKKTSSSAIDLDIGGFVPFSTSDYPGKMAAVLFCLGCPWECVYCHNAHLRSSKGGTNISWTEIQDFLKRRAGMLEAIVFSGGEATCQSCLKDAVQEVKAMGYLVGLHTAGVYPERLKEWLPLIDWVGLDIKAAFENYENITGVKGSGDKAKKSAELILRSGIPHEFRTTVHSSWLPLGDILSLAQSLSQMGVKHYALQEFRRQGCAKLQGIHEESISEELSAKIQPFFETFTIRRK